MLIIRNKYEQELIEKIRSIGTTGDVKSVEAYAAEVVALKKQIADLQIDKSRIEESNARQDRELRHEIGLERKRQAVELEQAKKEAVLTVREENLKAEQKRFDERMEFVTKQFDQQSKYLKENFAAVLDRLPTVTVDRLETKKR